MCWQCDNPDKTIHDYVDLLRARLFAQDWLVQYVEGRRPFAYTIGLHRRGLPEFLVTGLDPHRAGWLLNTFAKRTLAGEVAVPGSQVRLPAGTHLELVTVDHPDPHLAHAFNVQGPGVTAIQLVWADAKGRWPWAPNFDGGGLIQPVLGLRGC